MTSGRRSRADVARRLAGVGVANVDEATVRARIDAALAGSPGR